MAQCSACHSEIAAGSHFCSQCGSPSGTSSQIATVVLGQAKVSSGPSRFGISSAVDEGRFPPGTLLAQRYRVSGQLGKGGMGEVYKATDLLVGQTVALKFLPAELAASESMLERFRNEVRLARQVSHPNVCRVYDLGEADGHLFLSMEYIDGEDLSSLLRRIGQLPPAKAREIAHKLCAGLAAAHEKGVIHRDFKPANIMLDGRGHVFITDFGLAAAGVVEGGDVRSGTPAYMAPEQLSGEGVTARSDVYALGLVLYEIFTGRPPFEASSREELLEKQAAGLPPMKDVDAAVESAILRCLETDPRRRPSSALAVANALAGGDPLQAAVAAGQTPSPEMVAAAGETEAMSARTALSCLAITLVGLAVVAVVAGKGWAFSRVASEIPPDAMAQKARDALFHIGYAGKPFSAEWGYNADATVLERLAGLPHEEAWRRIGTARPPAIAFWYRQSPDRMVPGFFGNRHVDQNDPPNIVFGMVAIRLDPQGRLCRLIAVPSRQKSPDHAAPYQWQRLFEAAGLDMTRFAPAEPQQIPYFTFDEIGAWVDKAAAPPLRVEAAAWRGAPVWLVMSEDEPAPSANAAVQARFSRSDMAGVLFSVFLLVAEAILAWRNLKMGRGDSRGAWRLGGAVALLSFCYCLLSQGHGVDYGEYRELLRGLAESLLAGGRMAAAYLAFEPFIRRRWPDVLISWTRMLAGSFRDPLVGRHLLIGLCGGVLLSVVYKLYDFLLGPASSGARAVDLYAVTNTARILGVVARCLGDAVGDACWCAFLVFVFALALRKRWAAAAFASLLWGGVQASGSAVPLLTLALWLFIFGVLYLLLFRFGLLACLAYAFAGEVIMSLPVTTDTSAWYFGASAVAIVTLVAAAWYCFRTATGWRPVWQTDI